MGLEPRKANPVRSMNRGDSVKTFSGETGHDGWPETPDRAYKDHHIISIAGAGHVVQKNGKMVHHTRTHKEARDWVDAQHANKPQAQLAAAVSAGASTDPAAGRRKELESYFREGDEPAQGDATKNHPLHGKAVHINPRVRGGGKIGTAYAAGSQRGFYQVKRNGAHHGYYHESDLSEKPFGAKHSDEKSAGATFSDDRMDKGGFHEHHDDKGHLKDHRHAAGAASVARKWGWTHRAEAQKHYQKGNHQMAKKHDELATMYHIHASRLDALAHAPAHERAARHRTVNYGGRTLVAAHKGMPDDELRSVKRT